MPVSANVKLGRGVRIVHPELVNLYGCTIGDDCVIGPFVEIQEGVVIGARCKISSHSFLCTGVTIDEEVFIGHGVMFTNDRFPKAANPDGTLKSAADWKLETTHVGKGASVGSGATILPGVSIGQNALVGAGAVVTKNVPDNARVAGTPAKILVTAAGEGVENERRDE